MSIAAFVDPNEHDRFILRQRFRFVVNEYEFSLPQADGTAGPPFCFVKQKAFKFKEDIRFYTNESQSEELMRIKARQRFDPRARYDVTAADGTKLGEIQKVFGKSLLRSTYKIYDSAGAEAAIATEQNIFIALFRRVVGLVPFIGGFSDWLPIPYDFIFLRGEQILGHNRRRWWRIGDLYTIDFSGDPQRTLDRRLILAITVGMDALQAR